MGQKFSSIISRLCIIALSIIGYNSCNSGECMYGTPTGSFEIKGEVSNEDGFPVKEAIIRVTKPESNSDNWSVARTITNIDGTYNASGECIPRRELKVVCIPTDNTYEPDSINVPVTYKYDKKHKKDAWYEGHASVNVDFKLKQISGN